MNKSKLNLSEYISHPKLTTTSFNIKNRKLNKYINNAVGLNTDFSYKITNLRQQWNNNIYKYNTNNSINIPQQDKIIDNLITNYFRLYNKQLERKASIKYIVPKYKNRLINKIFVDVSNIKHTNDNVTITLFVHDRSDKYILNKLNKLDFTYNIRFTNNRINRKNLSFNSYSANKNISVKSLYNDMLFNNNNNTLLNDYKTKFNNKTTQYLHDILLQKKINKNVKARKHAYLNMLYANNMSINLYKFISDNNNMYLKPKYLKMKFNEFNKKKVNKICLFTKMYINKEKHIIHKTLTRIPRYILIKLNSNKYNIRNIKINQKKFALHIIKQLNLKQNNLFTNNTNSRVNSIKLKQNPSKLFYMFKLKKSYKNKTNKLLNRKKNKNIRSDSLLKHYISKFNHVKSEFNLIKHIKVCFNLIKSNTQFDNSLIHNVSIKSLIDINNMYKFYNINNKKNYIINQLQKKLIVYYKHMLVINRFKYENIYLTKLRLLLCKLYNKNVKFNIINLKHPSLNSNIYSQIICFKAKSRKFAIRTIFNWALNSLCLKRTVKFLYKNKNMEFNKFKNVNLIKNNKPNKDLLTNNIIYYLDINNINSNTEDIVFSHLKNKFLKGVKLQAKGRLTKRLTASRSIFKYGQKGSIRNFESSYTGLYGYLLRGNIDSNVQYNKLESKNRNGAFGLKGWYSSM